MAPPQVLTRSLAGRFADASAHCYIPVLFRGTDTLYELSIERVQLFSYEIFNRSL